MSSNEEIAKRFKRKIFSRMTKMRSRKYWWFLLSLKSFRYFSLSFSKGDLMECYYALMRYIDDIVDGDYPLPKNYSSKESFVKKRLEFLENLDSPSEDVDFVLLYCIELADRLGFKIIQETEDILHALYFDVKRYGKGQLFTEKELFENFYLLDIRGVVTGCLKFFTENPKKYPLLERLGIASRIYYTLRDFEEDISSGLINISKEDCKRLNIHQDDFKNKSSPKIRRWFREKALLGLSLLGGRKKIVINKKFNWLINITLELVYRRPAKKYFEKILKNTF